MHNTKAFPYSHNLKQSVTVNEHMNFNQKKFFTPLISHLCNMEVLKELRIRSVENIRLVVCSFANENCICCVLWLF